MARVHAEIAAGRRKNQAPAEVLLQRQRKDGSWGKPFPTRKLREDESPEAVLVRIQTLNPSAGWRLAE